MRGSTEVMIEEQLISRLCIQIIILNIIPDDDNAVQIQAQHDIEKYRVLFFLFSFDSCCNSKCNVSR